MAEIGPNRNEKMTVLVKATIVINKNVSKRIESASLSFLNR